MGQVCIKTDKDSFIQPQYFAGKKIVRRKSSIEADAN